jgi:hypothetical protein
MRPTYGKNFSSKFLYLQEDIAVGVLDFQNPKEIRKYKNTKKSENPKSAVSPLPQGLSYRGTHKSSWRILGE